MRELDDNTLLRQYVERNSEEAFATLVTRHVNKVYSVALRHTSNPHQAEEITQAVFVILARKSRQLGKHSFLSGWLYQTARLTTLTFIRSEMRRVRREQEAQMRTVLNEREPDSWRQIAPLLDAAVAGLNEADRRAIILRFFDSKNFSEVGAALGATEEAAKKRVSRALEKLRTFFSRRGVTCTSAMIAGVISDNSIQSAPAGMAKTISAMVFVHGGAVGGSTSTLVKGALKLMAWSKAKTIIISGVAILAVTGTMTAIVQLHDRKKVKPPMEDIIKQINQYPGGTLTSEAAAYLTQLKRQGRLPGFSTNDPAKVYMMIQNLSQDRNGAWQFSQGDTDTYPASRTLHASKNNTGQFLYYYTVVKESKTNDWQLTKAWHTDVKGNVIEEFAVP